MNKLIQSFDVRGSMLVFGLNEEMLSLSADSLQSMAGAVEFEQVHSELIYSLVFSKDGKYYIFTLSMYQCINYDLYVIN